MKKEKKELNFNDFTKIINNIAKTIQAKSKMLSKLDSAIGDGDHGATVERGFKNVLKEIERNKPKNISNLLNLTGKTLLSTMGGASGPLFGTFFTKMGEEVTDIITIKLIDIYNMFSFSLKSLMKISGAKPGCKTLIDSLFPAVESLKKSVDKRSTLKNALKDMVVASEQGMISTKNLVATKGRARYLKERAIGHQDVGATSMYLIIKAFYESIF